MIYLKLQLNFAEIYFEILYQNTNLKVLSLKLLVILINGQCKSGVLSSSPAFV